jgi:hypothetical protein
VEGRSGADSAIAAAPSKESVLAATPRRPQASAAARAAVVEVGPAVGEAAEEDGGNCDVERVRDRYSCSQS